MQIPVNAPQGAADAASSSTTARRSVDRQRAPRRCPRATSTSCRARRSRRAVRGEIRASLRRRGRDPEHARHRRAVPLGEERSLGGGVAPRRGRRVDFPAGRPCRPRRLCARRAERPRRSTTTRGPGPAPGRAWVLRALRFCRRPGHVARGASSSRRRVGGSAGSITALRRLLPGHGARLPGGAALGGPPRPGFPGREADILARAGALPAALARDGDRVSPGRILVAAPDHHLVVEGDRVRVTRGARENLHRPSIDVLFRSAAVAWGPAVIAVLLSGMLDDGTAGLWSVKRRGGYALVQDAEDAEYPTCRATRWPRWTSTKSCPRFPCRRASPSSCSGRWIAR